MNKPRIVMVTTWFYPINSVASNRMNAFVKYLDDKRFDVSVVTRRDQSTSKRPSEIWGTKVYRERSNRWLKRRRQQPSDSGWVHKAKSLNNILLSYLMNTEHIGWAKRVTKRLELLHKEQPIDVLISSYAPYDAHHAAFQFIRNHPETKWLADMRDEMSCNPFLSERKRKSFEKFEKKIAPFVDTLTTVSLPLLEAFKRNFTSSKLIEIRNGFDHEKQPIHSFNEQFTVLYAGSFYGEHKPTTFFKALEELEEEGKLPGDWRLKLLGSGRNFIIPKVLEQYVRILPSCSNEEAINEMRKADCNLLMHPSNGRKGVYTGKLFEYISVHKPILALVDTEDVAAELIREHHAGFIADFYKIETIKDSFMDVYTLWKEKKSLPFDGKQTEMLHRKHQVMHLEKALDELLGR